MPVAVIKKKRAFISKGSKAACAPPNEVGALLCSIFNFFLMKASITSCYVLIVFSLIGFSCVDEGPMGLPGPEGPRGPRGPQGEAGSEALVFEYENVDFLPPYYSEFLNFPDYQALPSDVVLVYALWDIQKVDGEIFEVWRLLPQTTFPNEGTLVYNYNHTDVDVELFLDANFSIVDSELGYDELDDWVIRIVIVPGQFLSNGRSEPIDFSDYQAVKERFNLPDMPSPDFTGNYRRPESKKN